MDPYGWSSIDEAIIGAVASGNPEQAKIIQAAIQRLNSTADEIISKECKASVISRFPKSVLNNALSEIKELARDGDSDARTAWKLLNENRFKK